MSAEPLPSATVVLIRDTEAFPEVLLLERTPREGSEKRGPWVFPGGKVERGDEAGGVEASAVRAAVRETEEEAGLTLDRSRLVPISRWITPALAKRRFDARFYLAPVSSDAEVRVDGKEICSHLWIPSGEAIDRQQRGELSLAPPTFVTLSWLIDYRDAATALRDLASREVLTFRPRICTIPDGACMLYPGDAGYDDGDPDREGAHHRLWTLPDGWRYERD